MPAATCAFPGYHATRTKKYKGISIFQIPSRKDEFYSEWRKSIFNALTKFKSLNKWISMKEYLKVIFTSVRDIIMKMILNSQVS